MPRGIEVLVMFRKTCTLYLLAHTKAKTEEDDRTETELRRAAVGSRQE